MNSERIFEVAVIPRQSIPRQSRGLRVLVGILLQSVCYATLATEPLLLVGQSPVEASLLRVTTEGELQFQIDGETRSIRLPEMVRWSTQLNNTKHSELFLVDGSRLVLADAWTGQPPWQLTDDSISVTTKLLGKVDLQRKQVRAIFLRAPKGLKQRRKFIDRLLNDVNKDVNKSDHLYLTNGDKWQGKIVRYAKNRKGSRKISMLLDSASEPLQLPEDRVAAIRFRQHTTFLEQTKNLVVGLRDGGLLMAKSIVTDAEQLRLRLACGVELTGSDRRDIVYLRSLTSNCVYLSDLVATDYLHMPYLEIPWPFQRDRSLLGGPLRAASRNYAKGLGMHTATRLTYSLEIGKGFQRFVASVAVDDIAEGRGSVVFRVYLRQDDDWQQAFASPVVRGGETPIPVAVKLSDAKRLALVTDFADRGDELDYANWLEARLE